MNVLALQPNALPILCHEAERRDRSMGLHDEQPGVRLKHQVHYGARIWGQRFRRFLKIGLLDGVRVTQNVYGKLSGVGG